MADRLYLSLWFPSFGEAEMMPRTLSLLKQFPFSASRPGIGHLAVHGISWNEPPVFEETVDSSVLPEQAIALASEHIHSDHAYQFDAMWDLWSPETGGGLDTTWRLTALPVQFLVHGTDFEDEIFQEHGHIEVDFGLDTPFLHEELELDQLSEDRVKANVQKLVAFTIAVEKNCGVSSRLLWSDSEENLVQKLIARLQKVN
ncbi:MAG: hypothetical protein JOZ10_09820 [Acidobacteria bacterium]|nr:hypothetical protein [Acidobacteriota bacterium]MBV9435126.1 hypothetical protein [Acidobacteriota bacterium]